MTNTPAYFVIELILSVESL